MKNVKGLSCLPLLAKLLALCLFAGCTQAAEESSKTKVKMYANLMPLKLKAHAAGSNSVAKASAAKLKSLFADASGPLECNPSDGLIVGAYPCKNMNLAAFMTGEDLGSPYAAIANPVIYSTWVSDIWGWVDPVTSKEYALVGMWDGTSIVDITVPTAPKAVAFVETTFGVTGGLENIRNIWRDIKVIGDVMYVGAEVSFHGIETFDLTSIRERRRGILARIWSFIRWLVSLAWNFVGDIFGFTDGSENTSKVPIVSPNYITPEIGLSHNLVAAPEAGKLIAVGMSLNDKTCPGKNIGTEDETAAALAIFDITANPLEPTFETCVDVAGGDAGYVHDAHCIKYDGPDTDYTGVNICALFMESDIVIYNLDTKVTINSFSYATQAYVHQGWFSEDHTTLYADDELDELFETSSTDFSTCYIFDLTDLDATIQEPTTFVTPSDHPSIDHNLYTKDGYIYQAAYTSGARIRKIRQDYSLEEVAYFDGELTCDCVLQPCFCDSFDGTWTYYPYFDSGITVAGGTSVGLFILQPTF